MFMCNLKILKRCLSGKTFKVVLHNPKENIIQTSWFFLFHFTIMRDIAHAENFDNNSYKWAYHLKATITQERRTFSFTNLNALDIFSFYFFFRPFQIIFAKCRKIRGYKAFIVRKTRKIPIGLNSLKRYCSKKDHAFLSVRDTSNLLVIFAAGRKQIKIPS